MMLLSNYCEEIPCSLYSFCKNSENILEHCSSVFGLTNGYIKNKDIENDSIKSYVSTLMKYCAEASKKFICEKCNGKIPKPKDMETILSKEINKLNIENYAMKKVMKDLYKDNKSPPFLETHIKALVDYVTDWARENSKPLTFLVKHQMSGKEKIPDETIDEFLSEIFLTSKDFKQIFKKR